MATQLRDTRKANSHRNTIKKNLNAFIKEWKNETREDAEAKSFWDAFFSCFGIKRKEIAAFEYSVERSDKSKGFIDLFWKGVLLVEHKSRGKSLDKAESQAFDYVQNIKRQADIPRYVLLSDFATFRLYDLEGKANKKEENVYEITIEALADNLHLFDFMSGLENHGKDIQEKELNIKAAENLGKLHDALQESNYIGHDLEVFLVRILFCLFAEDTGIFNRHQFYNFIRHFTKNDGSDTDIWIHKIFQTLDHPDDKRSIHLMAELDEFPYVNGHLFKEKLELPTFDKTMRETLLHCSLFDWGGISPAIFGSLFQSIMDKGARRELGAHYTSETNILRLIEPLFLDDLKAEFSIIKKLKQKKNKQTKLSEFQKKLTRLQFFDPACGCGNFLIITYRELRRLELAVLQAQQGDSINPSLRISIEPTIKLDHFHGIEIEEFPARIAEVAMWLTQHQMNKEFAKQFGVEPELLPLKSAAHIVNNNALQIDWETVVKPEELDFIIGNPPFVGKKEQNPEQKKELLTLFKGVKSAGVLDYVSCWYLKSTKYMNENKKIKSALVSTNSISHGEQVMPLWTNILKQGIQIHFAHRTFKWDSEAKGKAAVHVVIIGFSFQKPKYHYLFSYDDGSSDPSKTKVKQINPYLVEATNTLIGNRNHSISNMPKIIEGITPLDNGILSFSKEEYLKFIKGEPQSKKWFKPWVTGFSFINRKENYCLWLSNITGKDLRKMPQVMTLIQQVKEFRENSKSSQKFADTPWLFRETKIAKKYILIPKTSSEKRLYIPMGFIEDAITSSSSLILENATLYHFGILESEIHMDWMRTVCGRLKSDYRYSAKLVYNNFPFPNPTKAQKEKVKKLAQKILDIREESPDSSLAVLYDNLIMPPKLRKAHKVLDRAVEQCYRKEKFKNDMDRLSFLFERYAELRETDK